MGTRNTRRITVRAIAAVALFLTMWGARSEVYGSDRTSESGAPNVLIIMADDCTYNDLPLYGGANARTPHIDRLASEGLTFDRAYLGEAICQPCRAELFTGLYPLSNGCTWNHSASRPDVRSLPHHLGALGYRVGLAGKVHVKPDSAFPFEPVGGFEPYCTRDPTRPHDLEPTRQFLTDNDDQPFCLVVALVEPHVPWVMGDASAYPIESLRLPANIADNKRTRSDFAHYLAEITYMDAQVGVILEALEQSGQADRTLVLFTSEQGSQFPGNKWTCFDTGLHTALIARWPGRIESGRRTDAFVQYADIAPTLVDLAGGDPNALSFDGRSMLDVLEGRTNDHCDYVYGMLNNLPEGPAYPIRTISDGRFRYIRNLTPDELYIEKHLMGWNDEGRLNNPYWATWVRDSWNNPRTYRLVKRYMSRPAEQLFETSVDPYEMNNLADDPDHAEVKARLADELERWMDEQGDPGTALDTHEALRAARNGRHRFP